MMPEQAPEMPHATWIVLGDARNGIASSRWSAKIVEKKKMLRASRQRTKEYRCVPFASRWIGWDSHSGKALNAQSRLRACLAFFFHGF